jgi:SprB repeat
MKTKLIYCLFVSMFFGMFQSSAQNCVGFKTFGMGGWGTQCHGGNPGCYRDAHFDAAFPDGLRIGNDTNSLTLTSTLAVENFLPSGTTPRALNSGALVDPGSTYKNVLAGQLVTLTLSVGFDAFDPNFAPNTLLLGNLIIANGTFAGMTVTQFLQIANNAIGGATTGYSYSQINNAAKAINNNFIGGTVNNGYLTCSPIVVCNPIHITSLVASCAILCYGDHTGMETVTITGGIAPYTYTLSNGMTLTSALQTVTFNGLGSGTYTITVADSSGLTTTGTFTINQPTVLAATTTFTNTGCNDGNTGSITATATGGTAPYTILWSNGSTNFTVSDLAVGTYTAVITDVNGCSTNISQTITVSSGLVAANVIANISCYSGTNGSIITTVTSGTAPYSILWSNGSTSFTLSNLAAGSYTAVITDANGCTSNISATLTQPLQLTTTYVQTNPTACVESNGTLTVTVAGGTAPYTILWSNGSTSYSLADLVAGSYTYVVTDANGCQSDGAVIISPTPNLDTIHAVSDATCFGANNCSISTTVTGGTAPYTILWSNGSTSFSQTNIPPETYTAVITDASGCTSSTSVTAIEPPVLQLFTTISASTGTANDGSIFATASGGTGPYTYLWNNGSTNPIQTNLAPGTYTCTVTDSSLCSTTLSATILLAASDLLATAVVTNVSCFGGNNGSIVVTASLGTAPYTILWANGSTNFTLSNLISGTYSATVTDATGFNVTISGTVTAPLLLLSNTNVFTNATCCTGNNGTINVTPLGGTAPYTILWSNGSTAFSLDNLVGGTYTYVITDANGCTTNGFALIRAVPILASTYVATPATCTNNNGSITVTASGGTSPYTILWTNGSTSFALTNITNGTYSYLITDANGCQNNQVVNLVPLATTLESSYVTTLATCAGNDASITVIATGGTTPYTILWSNGSTSFTIGELAAGTYTYTVTDANGCSTNGSVTIQAIPNIDSIHVTTNASCFSANNCSITTTVTGGTAPYTILWSNGSTSFSQTNLSAGTYTAVITDANGCYINTSVTVTEPPVLVLT